MFARPYAWMVFVTDMKAAVAFYTEKLGFAVRFQEEGWSELTLGGITLALHGAEKRTAIAENHPHMILEVADIEKAMGELKEQRVEVHSEISDVGGGCGRCSAVIDPSGNLVGLYQQAVHQG